MSVEALKKGVVKSKEMEYLWPERAVLASQSYIIDQMKMVWTEPPDKYVMSSLEAISYLKMEKSPGYPYYFKHKDKQSALYHEEELILSLVERIMSGDETVQCIFALAEKSELRVKEKVLDNKTRIFTGSDMHHLIASKRLYELQNSAMLTHRDRIPIPLGLQLPGPEYVSIVTSMDPCIPIDLSGCDHRFALRSARAIRNIRHAFLPPEYFKAGEFLYNSTYCGAGAVMGGIYRMYNQKSGWENTAHDNSLMSWYATTVANFVLYENQPIGSTFRGVFYNDDWLMKQYYGDWSDVLSWLTRHGVVPECQSETPIPAFQVGFLSHSLKERFHPIIGDFVLAAGNLDKLLSSMNWTKVNSKLSFEESCVAHLLGLRICLYPWANHFERVDDILSTYLREVVFTDFLKAVMPARLSELDLAKLHTRVEAVSFFGQLRDSNIHYEVLKVVRRLIKDGG